MNATIFRRLLWKEFRTLCGFWIAMLALALLFLLIPLASRQGILGHITDATAAGLYYLASFFVALYAAGCGAMLFSSERETRTYWFLRSLPAASSWLLLGKTVFATASTLLIFVLISVSALFLGGFYLSDATNHVRVWIVCLAATLVGLAWGVFFSLLSKRPLVAVLLAVSLASLCVNGAAMYYGDRGRFSLEAYYAAVPVMLAVFCLVAAADIALGRRWLSGIGVDKIKKGRIDETEAKSHEQTSAAAIPAPRSHTGLRHLIWQQLRQSKSTIGALAVAAVPLTLLAFCLITIEGRMQNSLYPAIWLLSWMMATLIGSCVFLADHRRDSVRFLAERTARPTYVWLSRQIVWLFVLLPVIVVSLVCVLAAAAHVSTFHYYDGQSFDHRLFQGFFYHAFFLLAYIFAGYTAGQLCSMMFRSGILAVIFGMTLAFVLGGWVIFTAIMGASWLWSFLPIVIGLFLATHLRMSDWMQGRSGWKPRIRLLSCTLLPALAICVAIPFYRAYSIPLVEPGFDVEELAQSESSIAMYTDQTRQKVSDLLDRGGQLVADGELDKAFEQIFSAHEMLSSGESFGFYYFSIRGVRRRAHDLLRSWAAAPDQTPERIEAAIRKLDELDKQRQPPTMHIAQEYINGRSGMMAELEDGSAPWFYRLPWEKQRALRTWNFKTKHWMDFFHENHNTAAPHYTTINRPGHNWDDNFLLLHSSNYELFSRMDWPFVDFFNFQSQMAINRAATKIVLALSAWKLRHGTLPQTLQELATEYPGEMPNPSFNGVFFRLFPKGLPSPIIVESCWWNEDSKADALVAGTPFLLMKDVARYKAGPEPQWKIGIPRTDADLSDDHDRGVGFREWIHGLVVPLP